jgi:UDP-glucuronate 4-epimerase
LLKNNHNVTIIDNFNDYYDPIIKRKNIEDIKRTLTGLNIKEESLNIFGGDIRDKEALEKLFSCGFDIVVHLAAMAGVRYSIENPELYYDVNVMGTLNILEMCKKTGVKRVVFASSSSVYGNNKKVPFSEDDVVDYPISPYAATKKAGELLSHTYHHLYGLSIACLRFFTVYGPRQRPDLAIHKFSRLILENKPIPFYGDGSTKRDYTYISDIIHGILKAIDWTSEPKPKFDVFNLGESNTISLSEMIKTIEKSLNMKANLNIMPMQPGDVECTYADISKSKRILEYNPTMSFDEGIDIFTCWLNSIL